ncbi:MAG TPA: bifunctional alpha/beta hydrolase/OsmC family protein [Longimicrobiaceae bacterium]|nr:bifunctional alpha/beta hydrolase/OsmC family protein [Longimicrobiaceae bacterium]
MHTVPLTFTGSRGHTLAARLDLPPGGEPVAWALSAHCFTCTKNLTAQVNLSRALAREGVAVLRFDFTGLGGSEGDFAETGFSSNVDDLVAAAGAMTARGIAPTLLIGHSLGGTAALCAAPRISSLRGVVTIAAPSDPWHVAGLLGESRAEIEASGQATVHLGGQPFTVTRALLDDLRAARVEEELGKLGLPLLVMHSPRDQTVGVEHAARIFQAAKHPRSFVSLDPADHLLTGRADAAYAGRMIAAWATRWLPESPAPPLATLTAGGRVVTETGAAGFRTEARAGRHVLVLDEPVAVGGADAGPTPYDLLLAALGACTGMTLRMYAARKGWPLEGVTVQSSHSRVHALDGEACPDREPRMDRVERQVRLEGPLDAEQRARLLEIADRCPVHRTLSAGAVIATRAAGD